MGDKKLQIVFVLLLVAIAVQLYLKQAAAAGSLGYRGSLESAIEEAEESGKPILLVFGGDWCPACCHLEENVFSDPRIKDMAKHFVPVRIDPRDGNEGQEYRATRFVPEVVFLTTTGKVIARIEDRSSNGVLKDMEQVVRRVENAKRRR